MICILCSPEDTHALWLATQLQARGREVELVLPEEILVKSQLRLSVCTQSGGASLRLARGLTLDDRLAGLINRLYELPPMESTTGRAADSLFVAEEWRAAIVTFLGILSCPVLNRPTGANLFGQAFGKGHWRSLATQVGLAVAPWTSEDNDQPSHSEALMNRASLFVAGGRVLDPLGVFTDHSDNRLRALTNLVGLQLCSAEFDLSSGQPAFTELNPLPPFAAGGDALVATLDEVMVEAR